VTRIGEIVERQLVGFGNRIGPGGADQKAVGVARYLERRILKRGRIADQLRQRVVKIALLLLVFPGKEAFFPDIGEAVPAAGLGDALFEREPLACGIGGDGVVMPEQGAKRSRKWDCAAARSVSATGLHFAMNCCGVIGRC
jgi:hypothetical protein